MTIVVRFWRTVSIASLDLKFGEGIEGGRGFVQKENPGVLEQRADEGGGAALRGVVGENAVPDRHGAAGHVERASAEARATNAHPPTADGLQTSLL